MSYEKLLQKRLQYYILFGTMYISYSNKQKKETKMETAAQMITRMRSEMAIETCKIFAVATEAFARAVAKAIIISDVETAESYDKMIGDC